MDSDKTITIKKIMTPLPLETTIESKNIFDLALQMNKAGRGAVIVVDEKKEPIGIVTERDIVRRVVAQNRDPKQITVTEIMSKPLLSADPELYIYDAALIMNRYRIRRLPAVRDNVLHGIVTTTDLARYMYEKNNKDPTLQAMSVYAYRTCVGRQEKCTL